MPSPVTPAGCKASDMTLQSYQRCAQCCCCVCVYHVSRPTHQPLVTGQRIASQRGSKSGSGVSEAHATALVKELEGE